MSLLNVEKESIYTEKKELGLYIHIPFCIKKCGYCDFLSFELGENEQKNYMNALVQEIKSYEEIGKEYIVKTIFIGGGTPSSVSVSYIEEIVKQLREIFVFSESLEFTIESNPGTLTKEKLDAYLKQGINRLSIGLQSANNEELKILGRIHNYEEFVKNYMLARKVGYTNINVDSMSSLPNQTAESWLETLNKVIELQPEHISAYSLIIEENTAFYSKYKKQVTAREQGLKIPDPEKKEYGILPEEETERDIYYYTKKVLFENGYGQYEISNYSKNGYECRHNISYWKRIPYIGLGLGASSLIENMRFQNEMKMDIYLEQSSNHTRIRRNIVSLSITEQMEEFMFLGLRMCEGISRSEFKKCFGTEIEAIYGEVLNQLERDLLLNISNDRVTLTEKGIDLSNYVLSQFLMDE